MTTVFEFEFDVTNNGGKGAIHIEGTVETETALTDVRASLFKAYPNGINGRRSEFRSMIVTRKHI